MPTPGHTKDAARNLLLGVVLVAATLAAYVPAMRGGFIWDDDYYVSDNQTLRTTDGLRRIWLEPGAVPQYYPLVHTTYWVEYRLWQDWAPGYHAVNVVLHALSALLVATALRRLQVPGAWFAALLFALHPVHVESVAWITERKNVLSGLFYLLAVLAYCRFANLDSNPARPGRCWGCYTLALALFLCALLSKTVTASLPAALLLLIWWKRGRIGGRDIAPLVPFFALGIALGLVTVWMEKHHVGAQGELWHLALAERLLVAGRAAWFYAGKLCWPRQLTFIYPRWQLDVGQWWQYLFPFAALCALAVLWGLRRIAGRGPLTALLFFGGTLVPALGFFDVYPFRFSFVADHFQYLASLGLIALFAGVGSTLLARLGPRAQWCGPVAGLVVLAPLAVLTWQQGHIYKDRETLWRTTIARNPTCWMAYSNLGLELRRQGNLDEALAHAQAALRLKPDYAEHHGNLGIIRADLGQLDEAIRHYRAALAVDPRHAPSHNNLGTALYRQGQSEQACEHYRRALELEPRYPDAHVNLGVALARQRQFDEAIEHYRAALRINPYHLNAHASLGNVLAATGQVDEALEEYRTVLRSNPNSAVTRVNLGQLLARLGRLEEALEQFREVVRIQPADANMHCAVGALLEKLGRADEAVAAYRNALRVAPDHTQARALLEAALGKQETPQRP